MANGQTVVEHRIDAEGADPLMLAGVNDRNVQELARLFTVRVVLRGDHVVLSGDLPAVERAVPVLQHMIELARMHAPFEVDDIGRFADDVDVLRPEGIVTAQGDIRIALPGSRRVIVPKSEGQRGYVASIVQNDIVIGIGPVSVTGDELDLIWKLTMGAQVLMAMPRGDITRMHLSHLVHHRGQLTVYLRLLDVPIPSIYGPTADERGI